MREWTPSLSKMLLMWRCTVLSLTYSSLAIAWFVLPAATNLSTSISRALKPLGPTAWVGCSSSSTRCRSGRAPRRAKVDRANSNSTWAASSSPTARHARPMRTETVATA